MSPLSGVCCDCWLLTGWETEDDWGGLTGLYGGNQRSTPALHSSPTALSHHLWGRYTPWAPRTQSQPVRSPGRLFSFQREKNTFSLQHQQSPSRHKSIWNTLADQWHISHNDIFMTSCKYIWASKRTTKLESCDRWGLLGKNVSSFNVDVRLTKEESTEKKRKCHVYKILIWYKRKQ